MTQKEEHLIKAILDSPFAPALVARLIAALEDEKKRRLQFYEDIDDDMKVEFINGEIVVHSPVKKEHGGFKEVNGRIGILRRNRFLG